MDLKLTKNVKGKQKKRRGLNEVVYLNNKRFTMRMNDKKDGIVWIVDLKGKREKKYGFCQVVYLKCKRLAKKKREKKKGLAKLWIWN